MFCKVENGTMALIVGDSANFSEHGALEEFRSNDGDQASDLNKLTMEAPMRRRDWPRPSM